MLGTITTTTKAPETGYQAKMDNLLRGAVTEWWNSLSKDEILDYLRDQPDITADHLRQLLANEEFVMAFGAKFFSTKGEVTADFFTT